MGGMGCLGGEIKRLCSKKPAIDVEHGDACLGEKEAEKRGDDTLPTTHVEYA